MQIPVEQPNITSPPLASRHQKERGACYTSRGKNSGLGVVGVGVGVILTLGLLALSHTVHTSSILIIIGVTAVTAIFLTSFFLILLYLG